MNLSDRILANEVMIRLGFLFGIFSIMAIWELISPRRLLTTSIGIHNYHDPRQVSWLSGILLLPFMGKITAYAINRREWSSDEK